MKTVGFHQLLQRAALAIIQIESMKTVGFHQLLQRAALAIIQIVGAPRIELGLSAPKADVLPVYYAPMTNTLSQTHQKITRSFRNWILKILKYYILQIFNQSDLFFGIKADGYGVKLPIVFF